MKHAILVVASLAGLLSAAFAQSPLENTFKPEWSEKPATRTFKTHYPRAALDSLVSGSAVLCCTPRADGKLTCEVGAEWPTSWGFGQAAAAIAQGFKLSEKSLAEYNAGDKTPLRIPTSFRAGTPSQEWENAHGKFHDLTANVCSAPPPIS